MAKLVSKITLGVDVAKDSLVIHRWDSSETIELTNDEPSIRKWLTALHEPVQLALEPTSHYHLAMVEIALALNHSVYLINPRQLAHYRSAVNLRHKSDPDDAWLLARYLVHEQAALRSYQPPSRQAQQLWRLLKRRATVVRARRQLQQSLSELQLSAKALLTQFQQLLLRIDRRLQQLLRALGWHHPYQRCCSIPGIGPLTATALVAAWHRGTFASSDAFVAFMGLDVRRRESGQYRGQRKLTKQGEAELRRLLYCAAQAARCHSRFADYRQRQLDKGLSKIAANVALARKLARIAFTLMQNQTSWEEKPKMAC